MAVSDWLGSVENLVAAEAMRLDDSAVSLWHFSPGRLLRATGLKSVLDPKELVLVSVEECCGTQIVGELAKQDEDKQAEKQVSFPSFYLDSN